MNAFWRAMTTWYHSNPRRWFWVLILLVVLLVLGLTGNLRQT
jgi:hypothetical protein